MAINAILFDMDNTLTDFVNMKRHSTRAAAKAMIECGLKMDEEECFKQLFETYWKEGIDGNSAFEAFIQAKLGKPNRKMLEAAIEAYEKERDQQLKLYPGVIETLAALKKSGLVLGIITDAPKVKAEARLKKLGLYGIFDVVVTFDDTGHHKPSDLPFKKALEQLGMPPEQVLMVGDSLERDVLGAQKMGIRGALAEWGRDHEYMWPVTVEVKPDFELKKLSDLLVILAKERIADVVNRETQKQTARPRIARK